MKKSDENFANNFGDVNRKDISEKVTCDQINK